MTVTKAGDHVLYFDGRHQHSGEIVTVVSGNGTRERTPRLDFVGGWVEAIVTQVNDDGTVNLRYAHPSDGEYIATGELTDATVMASADQVREGTGAYMWQEMPPAVPSNTKKDLR